MFDPNINIPSWWWDYINVIDAFSSVNLIWFQPWLEVCVNVAIIDNTGSSTETALIEVWFEQYKSWSWQKWMDSFYYSETIESGDSYAYWTRVWIDPDEIRPGITSYRYFISINWERKATKSFSVSNLSFDSSPHPAWYLWVEWNHLCYTAPSIYSGSSSTGYKHMIGYDENYSWWSWTPWYIWIPSSSSDHRIYYVTQNGYVYRTKESYEWSGWSTYVGTANKWHIRMTPSTTSRPEQSWYNYLCYVDWWWYKRRMWIGEIS